MCEGEDSDYELYIHIKMWRRKFVYRVDESSGEAISDHNLGRGAKYTKAHRPVELVYFETFKTKEEAMKRECIIKKMSRRQKLQLVNKKESF